MVVVNSSIDEMNALIGRKLDLKKYEELAFRYGLDLESDGKVLNFELTSDRVELVSKRAIAFLLSQLLGSNGKKDETIRLTKSDKALIRSTYRPFVNLLRVSLKQPLGDSVDELIALQEKLDVVIGRGRVSSGLGLFDADRIKFPIEYSETDRKNVSFIPLGSSNEKNFDSIMSETEQGRAFDKLVGEKAIVWRDATGAIFAMPPVINADPFSITKDTKELLVDITGNNKAAVNNMTTALIFNLQFLGDVMVVVPSYQDAKINTGFRIEKKSFYLDSETIRELLGVDMSVNEIARLLSMAGHSVKKSGKGLIVIPPFYRQDIIHQADIVDDLLRFYGVSKVTQSKLKTYTPGSMLENTAAIEQIRDILIGFGYQEADLNILTNENVQFSMTGIKPEDYTPLSRVKSGEISMVRKNLFPEALRLVSNNLHNKFPQNVFDVGYVSEPDVRSDVNFSNRLHMTILVSGQEANLSDVKSALDRVFADVFSVVDLKILPDDECCGRDVFIPGRGGYIKAGDKDIGVIGEVHPKTLNNFGIEVPVAVCEVYLDRLGL